MSYGSHTRNPWEHTEQDEDDDRFKCAGDCDSWLSPDDPTNCRIGRDWYCPECYGKHPVIVGNTMAEIIADEQQDDFNRSRR